MKKYIFFLSAIILIILLIIFINKYSFINTSEKFNNIKNNTFIIYKDSIIIKSSENPAGIFNKKLEVNKNIGTGFFINKNTFITAGHNVSENIKSYKITKNNIDFLEIFLEKIDKENDLAYLKINNFNNYKKIYFGNIFENKNIASYGYNPEKNILEESFGEILEIKNNKIYSNLNFVKGNSGGPLINASGEIIGINLNYDLKNKTGISYILAK